MEYSCTPFPLTPTLSPRRGGNVACPHQNRCRFDFGARQPGSLSLGRGLGWECDPRQKRTFTEEGQRWTSSPLPGYNSVNKLRHDSNVSDNKCAAAKAAEGQPQ